MKEEATNIIEKYNEWRGENDDSWTYDMIDEFFATLRRGELLKIIDLLKQEASL